MCVLQVGRIEPSLANALAAKYQVLQLPDDSYVGGIAHSDAELACLVHIDGVVAGSLMHSGLESGGASATATSRAVGIAGRVGQSSGPGEAAAGHDEVLIADRAPGQEVFQDFAGPGGVPSLGRQAGA
jgi:hypothetical protein